MIASRGTFAFAPVLPGHTAESRQSGGQRLHPPAQMRDNSIACVLANLASPSYAERGSKQRGKVPGPLANYPSSQFNASTRNQDLGIRTD